MCQNAVQPVNSQLSTIPKASDNIPVWASEANVTWVLTFNNASAWTFDGANCMFTSIYLPEDPALVLDHLSLSLMRLSDYASIVDPEAGTADLSLAAGGIIASCHGLQCNASASQWLYAANLEADMQYVVVISHDDGLTEVPYDTSSGFVMLQAATAGRSSPLQTYCSHARLHQQFACYLQPCLLIFAAMLYQLSRQTAAVQD